LTPAEVDNSPAYLMPFEIDENMKYVEDKMYADIQQYGMYTYEEFQQYMTMEQFYAFNFPIFKVSVGKGYFTYEDILYLISVHFNVEIQEVTVPYVQAMATSIASLANMPVALVDDSESTTPAEEPQQSEITPPADETVGGDDVTAETPADTTGEANGTDVTDGTQPTDSTEGEDVTVPSSDTGADGEDVAE